MEHDEVVSVFKQMLVEAFGYQPEVPWTELIYWFAQVSESSDLREDQVRRLIGYMIEIVGKEIYSPAFERILSSAYQLHHYRYVRRYMEGVLLGTVDRDELRMALWREEEGFFDPLIPTPKELDSSFWKLIVPG